MQNRYGMPSFLPRKLFPILLLGIGTLLIAASTYFILRGTKPPSAPTTVPVNVSFPAPELTLNDTDGVSRSLAEYRGQIVLVNLWATWCPPCKEEMPTLEAFYQEQKENGFVIIAINDGDQQADVLQFVKEYELSFPVWLDPTYIATEQAFHTKNLPTSFVIDRTGTIRLAWVGGISAETLDQYLSPLIREQQ
jgi:peroxiredoxin